MNMPIGLIFWVIMLLWIISWFGTTFGNWGGPFVYVSSGLIFILFFLLGWHDFGFIVHP
jgi:hypothetical protein